MKMNYFIKDVASIAGVSTRTLRYYDSIDLLKPSTIDSSGYRVYHSDDLNQLQQILIYKKLGVPLKKIKTILESNYNEQIAVLIEQKRHLERAVEQQMELIETIEKTIQHNKGEISMSDKEKFNGLMEQKITENEMKYGTEIRQKYGDETVDRSYDKMRKLSKWEYQEAERLGKEILTKLKNELPQNDPQSQGMQDICRLHQKWIQLYWPTYDENAHLSLVHMYTEDERFKAYYNVVGEGATTLLYNAMKYYLKKDN
jgi:DNA-binding transcriptional MerR regulator